jgi:formylglycine-generating enzyme required for sulfatase activity
MGSNSSSSDEKPAHKVNLDAFWIDKTEVTVGMYYLCVEAGRCQEPTGKSSSTHTSYYGNAEFNNYPVIYVDWYRATTYCEWVARRLPTEAEWEKAARGDDGRIYPWGNDMPNNSFLNYGNNIGDITEVGEFIKDISIYGALDMGGNVWEWVQDWYSATYYQITQLTNPLGPELGRYRVHRGGSWDDYVDGVYSSNRNRSTPGNVSNKVGFRCAMSATP